MRGFYEILVGMVKSSLRKAIQRKTIFRTYATECEHILNSRPLVYTDDNIRSTKAITPNHFLCLNTRNSAPTFEDDWNPDFKPQMESADELLEIWKKKDKHNWMNFGNIGIISISSVWGNDTNYACKNQESNQAWIQWWDKPFISNNAPRSKWRMGKIVQLIESRENEIRASCVPLPNGNTIKRPNNL